MSEIQAYRRKWNARYEEAKPEGWAPKPHPLGVQWKHRFLGGRALEVASPEQRRAAIRQVEYFAERSPFTRVQEAARGAIDKAGGRQIK